MNKQEAIEVLHDMSKDDYTEMVHIDDIVEIINKIDEPQKPVVPKFVAEWIGYCKFKGFTLLGALDPVSELGVGLVTSLTEELRKGKDWAQRNQETFTRAWLYGYEIEQDKLYTVEIPDPNSIWKHTFLTNRGPGVSIDRTDGDFWKDDSKNQLTESEIKQDFEWAFQFAKEVEG